MTDTLHKLVEALQQPALFPHPVTRFEVIETHISIVLLTGTYAYKFKKPVNFGFLDFSTLARRKHFCEEEFAGWPRSCISKLYRSARGRFGVLMAR